MLRWGSGFGGLTDFLRTRAWELDYQWLNIRFFSSVLVQHHTDICSQACWCKIYIYMHNYDQKQLVQLDTILDVFTQWNFSSNFKSTCSNKSK